jgi:hypothetical protein
MTTVRIRERENPGDALNAAISFDGGEEFPVRVTDPFSKQEEERLAWYFEDHLRLPFANQVTAGDAAASVTKYGESLFTQLSSEPEVYARYKALLQSGSPTRAANLSHFRIREACA